MDDVWEHPDHAQYPEDNPVLGSYFGPTTDVGPLMTSKILKSNGEVINRSTYHRLTNEEVASLAHIALEKEFNDNNKARYGPDCNSDDFPDVGLEDTPHYNRFDDVNMDLHLQDIEWLA